MSDDRPALDDGISGVPTYTEEYLRKHPKKRAELLAAPDGTVGKDVAQRVESAAPLVAEAVKKLREYKRQKDRRDLLTRSIADILAQMRILYVDKHGDPDMRGTSWEYREAAKYVFEKAGLPPDAKSSAQSAVRAHTGDAVRAILREDERFADGDEAEYLRLCEKYRYNPKDTAEVQAEKRARRKANEALPALRIPAGDVIAAFRGSLAYSARALEIAAGADVSELDDDERDELREQAAEARARLDEIMNALEE